ncbi:MAG: hypothetical protein Q7J98_01450 [Kiritimatiellia bacterium]|nr:hypothetical protein [Kiritimatiellia bacterium]
MKPATGGCYILIGNYFKRDVFFNATPGNRQDYYFHFLCLCPCSPVKKYSLAPRRLFCDKYFLQCCWMADKDGEFATGESLAELGQAACGGVYA